MAYRWSLYGRQPNEWAAGGTEAFPVGHVIGRPERLIVGTTGRQVGKTDELADGIDRAMNAEPNENDRTPDRPPEVGILSYDFPHAEKSVFKYIENLTRVFGQGAYHMNQNKHELTITDPLAGKPGAHLLWLSAQEEFSTVGNSFSWFGIDEAQAVPDRIIDKFMPTQAVRDAHGLVFGTPDTVVDQTWFQGAYDAGQDPLDLDTHSFTIPSWEAPWMNMESILRAKARMSDSEFRRLYGGEWIEAAGLVFPPESYRLAMTVGAPPYEHSRRYVMAVDLAIQNDFNVVMVGDPATRTVIYCERWNLTDPLTTYDKILELHERFGRPKVWVDATGMGRIPARELGNALGTAMVVPVEWSAGSEAQFNKMDAVRELAGALQHRQTMFPAEWDDLRRELGVFVYGRSPTGKLTAQARTGAHDDLVMTLVMLNKAFAARGKRGVAERFNYLSGGSDAFNAIREKLGMLNG